MANNFSGDSHCKALWRFESGSLTTDDIGSNTLVNYATRVLADTDSGDYREGGASAYFVSSVSPRMYIEDADLDADFPLKSSSSSASFSLCLWFKLADVSANYILVAKNVYLGSNDESLLLYTRDYGAYYGIRIIKGYNAGNSSEVWEAIPSLDLQAGRWYHLGLTWDDTSKQFHIVVWDDTAQVKYTDSDTQAYGMSLTTSPVNLGCRADSGGVPNAELNGWLDEVVVFNDILTETEIDNIRQETYGTGATEHELYGSIIVTSVFSGDVAVSRSVSGAFEATSFVTAILDCFASMAGTCSAQSNYTAILSVAGPVALAGATGGRSRLKAMLTRSRFTPRTKADWLQEALFSGVTSNAFKLGTILTGGWFWMRRTGCSALYRGAMLSNVDFNNIVSVVNSEAQTITLPDHLSHEPNSQCCYLVRRFNACGNLERTTTAAVQVRMGPDGNLAEPVPNGIYGLNGHIIAGDKVQLNWFYCSLDQQVSPAVFRVYGDETLQSELAVIPYEGRRFYTYLSESLPQGPHVFVIVAESVNSIQSLTLAHVNVPIRITSPVNVSLLSAEAMA